MLILTDQHCIPCDSKIYLLTIEEARDMLREVAGWEFKQDPYRIYKCFRFKNFYQTISFVNVVAWIANQENHHPRLEVEYNTCMVEYWTHSINGLSENDFICAAKINHLYSRWREIA